MPFVDFFYSTDDKLDFDLFFGARQNYSNGGASFYEDFLALGTNYLVDYLAVRGLKVSGTRIELVVRAFAAAELNLPITKSTKEQQNRLKLEYKKCSASLTRSVPLLVDKPADDITKLMATS